MERGSTNCTESDPLQKLQLYVAIEAVFAVISSLACLATIILFVVVKAYRSYVHRLTLYLAITSLFFAVSLGISMAPINTDRLPISPRNGWGDTCIAFGFLTQYFVYSSTLATLWLCANVFALSVFNVKIGKRGCTCEVGGYLVIFFVPCLVFWIPILNNSFGQTSVWCWIRCVPQVGSLTFAASLGPLLALYLISVVMVFVVVVKFLIELKRGHVRDAHKAALKEVLPLLIYPGMYSVVFGVAVFAPLYFSNGLTISIFRAVIQAIRILLPISFLLHPSIRRKLCAVVHTRYKMDHAWVISGQEEESDTGIGHNTAVDAMMELKISHCEYSAI